MRRWRLARCVLWAVLLSSLAAGELVAQGGVTSTPTPAASQAAATPAPTVAASATAAPTVTAAPTATPTPSPTGSSAAALISSIGAGLVLLVVACVLIALTVATYRLLKRFGAALDQRLPIGTRNHWGGFGGGESGWDLSPALALLIAVLVLAIATVGLGGALVVSALDWRKAELGLTVKPADSTASDKKQASASAGDAKSKPTPAAGAAAE